MPLYEFKCPDCAFRTSARLPVEERDKPLTSHCPKVDRTVTLERVISAPAIDMGDGYAPRGRVWSGNDHDAELDQAIRDSL